MEHGDNFTFNFYIFFLIHKLRLFFFFFFFFKFQLMYYGFDLPCILVMRPELILHLVFLTFILVKIR